MMTERPMVIADVAHVVVAYDAAKWAAVPANNGGNSPTWRWGEELLVGFTTGAFALPESLHQTVNAGPFVSKVGHTEDGNDRNGNPPAMVRTRDGRLCCVYGNRSRRQIIARMSADSGAMWGPAPLCSTLDTKTGSGLDTVEDDTGPSRKDQAV